MTGIFVEPKFGNDCEQAIAKIIEVSLLEDEAFDDITSDLTISPKQQISFQIAARENIIFCGRKVISQTLSQLAKYPKFLDHKFYLNFETEDGSSISAGKPLCAGYGSAKLIFAAERTILNLIQHLSGIATLTSQFVDRLQNQKIKILDTRKTTPGLRKIEKYAVSCGGGKNHRFSLSDMILVKDNHIASASLQIDDSAGIKSCLSKVYQGINSYQKPKNSNQFELKPKVEIECDNLSQVLEAVNFSPDVIMLDNMTQIEIKKSSALIRSKSPTTKIEVSGGVNLKNISRFGNLDIDFISVGSITNSARAVDIGLDIVQ